MTAVSNLVRVAVEAPIGNLDLSSQSMVTWMAQALPNLLVSRKVFNTVCKTSSMEICLWCNRDLPWRNIWSVDNPVEVFNGYMSLLIGRNVPTEAIPALNGIG